MKKERLQEIKDSIDLQLTVAKSIGTTNELAEEEKELYDEVVRLGQVKRLAKWLIVYRTFIDIPDYYEEGIIDCLDEVLDKLKELKEKNNGNLY